MANGILLLMIVHVWRQMCTYLNFGFKVKICSAIKSRIFKHKTSTSRIEISDKHNQTKWDSGTQLYETTKWNKQKVYQVNFILGNGSYSGAVLVMHSSNCIIFVVSSKTETIVILFFKLFFVLVKRKTNFLTLVQSLFLSNTQSEKTHIPKLSVCCLNELPHISYCLKLVNFNKTKGRASSKVLSRI